LAEVRGGIVARVREQIEQRALGHNEAGPLAAQRYLALAKIEFEGETGVESWLGHETSRHLA
jgi:hypothetical protein